ncbi:DUF4397 domain-containing protein [Kaarinaea lacus]
MKNSNKIFAALFVSITLVACSDDDPAPLVPTGEIRVLHTSPDAPPVNVLLDTTTAISALDYAESSGYASVATATYEVSVEAITPTGTTEVINVPALDVAEDSRTTVLAVGTVTQETPTDVVLEAITVNDSAATPGASEVAIRVVHASPTAGSLGDVDIYVTAPGSALTNPITLGFKGDADLSAVPADSYQIRITPNGNTTPILYDSGTVDLSSFAGEKLLIAAIDTTNDTESDSTDGAPVKLLVATDETDLTILDSSTEAGARVVHLSPNAGTAAGGPVKVFATADGGTAVELIPSFNYFDIVPAADAYVGVESADYVFDVAPASGTINDSVYTSPSLTFMQGSEYTAIAVGYVGDTPAFTLLATQDSNRSIATQASVKVVHGAAAVGTVDVYVTAAGDFTVADVEGGMAGMPLVPDFEFGAITDYVAVEQGVYDIRVVDQVSGTVVIDFENADLSNGDVVTAIAYGPDESDNDPATAGLMLLTN